MKEYYFYVDCYVTDDRYVGEVDSEEHASALEKDNVEIEQVTARVPQHIVEQIRNDLLEEMEAAKL